MAAYARYYRRFGKTYHVLLQLESIVLKGKALPSVSPLVDANFAAEVETLVLTAGHDVRKLHGEVVIDVARDGDQLAPMAGGAPKTVPAGDMIMRDAKGVCCSIIYGQDSRSPITAEASHVLYVAYAPAGVPHDIVEAHLRLIEEHARLVSGSAVTEQRRLLVA
jgi:DNA/RNA-binding domain of Phe-tRNA-synthetase-like protein